MPEVSIVATSVAVLPGGTANQIATVTARGVAGGPIQPGQVLYADPSANNQLNPALATTALQASNVVGIALSSAAANQPITYAIAGDVQMQSSAGSLVSGSVYMLAAGTAGNMVAVIDSAAPAIGSGNFASLIGVGNGTVSGTVSVLRLTVIPYATPL